MRKTAAVEHAPPKAPATPGVPPPPQKPYNEGVLAEEAPDVTAPLHATVDSEDSGE